MATYRVFRSKHEGLRCRGCREDIYPGSLIMDNGTFAYHYRCGQRHKVKVG